MNDSSGPRDIVKSAPRSGERRLRPPRFVLLCAVGVALNMACVGIAEALDAPMFPDTVGTVFAAVLGGYLPGVVTGFLTNFLKALYDPMQLYYGVLNILTGVVAAFFARRGFYDRFSRALLTIPVLIFVTSGLGAPLTWYLNHADFGGLASGIAMRFHKQAGFGRFQSQVAAHVLYELIGQSLTMLLVYTALSVLPDSFKNALRTEGLRQSLVPEEALAASHGPRARSLRVKMIVLLTASTLCVAVYGAISSMRLFRESTVNEYTHMARMLTSIVAALLDDRPIDDYLAHGYDAEGYAEDAQTLATLKDSYPDVRFLYVYRITEEGCRVVFDVDTADVKGEPPGTLLPVEDEFLPVLPLLLRGEPVEPVVSAGRYGWLLTVYYPVRDSAQNTLCYVGVDFSMNMLSYYGNAFLAKLVSLLLSFVLLTLSVGLWIVSHGIILPINSMAYCAGAFAYDSDAARDGNVARLRALDIRTGDEIENLYRAFLKTTEDSMEYVGNLVHARNQVAVMKEQVTAMDALATTDALTGVKNKTAYDQFVTRLTDEIAAGHAHFGIVMIDLNFLKRVNDTYGHEHGNVYIKRCCSLVCRVFDHSPVFRVGGDEFVVILEKSDFAARDALLARFSDELAKMAADSSLEPWEQVSAAAGIAVYDAARDQSVDEVFKRADQAMYANKQAMKAMRTD